MIRDPLLAGLQRFVITSEMSRYTEILLRITLLRILEDKTLFEVFCDPKKLEASFP